MKILEYIKRPVVAAVLAGVAGILLGLIWGWVIQPVEWKDAPPSLLHVGYQEDYLRMAIDSYGTNGDTALALKRYQELGSNGPAVLLTIQRNPGKQNPATIINFSSIVQPAGGVVIPTPGGTQATPTTGNLLVIYGVIAFGVIVLAVVGYGLFKFLRPKLSRRSGEATPAQQARRLSRQAEVTDYTGRGEETPIAQFVTTYVLGDDLFDDSFGIDSASGEFLGECGIGISETIGVGDPKKVTAFEVWMFDKNDIQTVTKVLMSSHAFNDVATFQRLEAKGEPILVERGKQVVLETAALQLLATISDVEYGRGALPDNSFFERVTLELAVWPKITAPVP
ncbi:MAG: hypothetical protein Q8N45_04860 [Anaerolineales bacterium]|nr:hypothetical protein [Anaerolineales bacterium]